MAGGGHGRRLVFIHVHVPARRVLLATAVTLVAAGAEIAGSWRGHSLFLVADAFHLFAHVSIFAVLLIPAGRWHEQGEDAVSAAVLIVVASIAVAVIVASLRRLLHPDAAPPEPMLMLLSLLGLGANVTTALLFAHPARTRWSFRAALARGTARGVVIPALDPSCSRRSRGVASQ